MKKLRIGIGGSAANPPHLGHKELIEGLLKSKRFDRIYWILSGARSDKDGLASPDHRVAMTILTFPTDWLLRRDSSFVIRFDDVYEGNTPTIEVIESFKKEQPDAEIVWFTGADPVVPQEKYGGKSEMQVVWNRGEELYRNHHFLVFPRWGFPELNTINLPPNFETMNLKPIEITSTEIRNRVRNGESIDDLVTKEVEEYILRNQLYKYP